MRRAAVVGATLALAALALTGCTAESSDLSKDYDRSAGKGYTSDDGSVVTLPAPKRHRSLAWTGTTDEGDSVRSSSLKGKVVVLNFWYASCPPCRAEAPDLAALSKRFASEDVVFLGVNTRDSAATARVFATKYRIDYPSVLDVGDNAVVQAYSGDVPPKAVPTTLVLDREGRVAARFSGRITSPATVGDVIDDVLADRT